MDQRGKSRLSAQTAGVNACLLFSLLCNVAYWWLNANLFIWSSTKTLLQFFFLARRLPLQVWRLNVWSSGRTGNGSAAVWFRSRFKQSSVRPQVLQEHFKNRKTKQTTGSTGKIPSLRSDSRRKRMCPTHTLWCVNQAWNRSENIQIHLLFLLLARPLVTLDLSHNRGKNEETAHLDLAEPSYWCGWDWWEIYTKQSCWPEKCALHQKSLLDSFKVLCQYWFWPIQIFFLRAINCNLTDNEK